MANGKTAEEKLDIIRKLMAKAESTTHPEEAKAFTEKAEALMIRWAIEEADLAKHEASIADTIGITDITIPANEYRGPKIQLLSQIATNHACRVVLNHQHYRCKVCLGRLYGTKAANARHWDRDVDHAPQAERVVTLNVAGFATDRSFVEILFTSLLIQREREFEYPAVQDRMWEDFDLYDGRPNARGGWRIKWHNTFGLSYAVEIGRRLRAQRVAVEAGVAAETGRTSESVALVLVSRANQVNNRMDDLFGKLTKGSGSSAGRGSYSAHSVGRQAGGRADLTGKPQGTTAIGGGGGA